jgi:hypothetical protein
VYREKRVACVEHMLRYLTARVTDSRANNWQYDHLVVTTICVGILDNFVDE